MPPSFEPDGPSLVSMLKGGPAPPRDLVARVETYIRQAHAMIRIGRMRDKQPARKAKR